MMSLSKIAVKRPVATGTILLLIMLIGSVSLYQSPLDLLPDIQPPVLAVITVFPGSSPQETLELVTRPVEEGVSAVSGLTNLNSFSQENLSLVIMQFDWGMDINSVREDVNVRMDLLNLPDGVQRPMVLKFDPTLMPIMVVSASGSNDKVQLTEWLEDTVSPRLESIPGVASVQVQGGAEQDLFVRTSPDTMAEYEVSFEQIANVLRASLVDLPAGIIDLEDRQVRIRFLGRYAEIEMLSDLVVGFQVDQEALEEMIGKEVDIDLNRMLAGQDNILSGGIGGGLSQVPMREIYWDDIFDFKRALVSAGKLLIPLNEEWMARHDQEIEHRLFLFTANPHISYEPEKLLMNLSLTSLGRSRIDGSAVSLEDIWIIEQAVWDSNRVIVPIDPVSMDLYALGTANLSALAESNPLIIGSGSNYLLVAFHENWENIRSKPIVSLPDYGAWLSNVQNEVARGVGDVTRQLEDSLSDLATTMILSSMNQGPSNFAGFEFDGDFPINPVSLGMLAEIKQDIYSPTTVTRFNRQPSISLVIQKEGDANTVLVSRQIRGVLDQLSEESAGGFSRVTFSTVLDQAEEIERALADLAWALAGGALLAIIVLILFLRNWRTTMFIGLSIPAAIIATFTLLYFANLTINLMTLGGLALAAGMLVDNAIVVSENIFRRYQMGENPSEASVNGAREVAGAITASTLTTISVFFPVVFISGLAGQIFWEFALTVACAILASLLVALTVIPLLASRSLGRHHQRHAERFSTSRLPTYRSLLKLAVRHPWWVLIFAAVFVAIGAIGFTTLGTELFPPTDESSFTISISLPPGTTLAITDAYSTEAEKILENRVEITSFSTTVGGSGFLNMLGGGGSSNQSRISVKIDPDYIGDIDRIIEEVRRDMLALPVEADLGFSRDSVLDTAGLESGLDLVVSGPDLDQIIAITGQAVQVLSEKPQFSDVQSSLEESRPEIHIRLDQSQALQKGVTQVQVATAVRQALEGIPVSRIETEAGILSIILGYQKSDIKTIEDLGRIGFYTPAGEFLRLEEIATLSENFGPRSIPRENQMVVGQIQLQYGALDLGTATSLALEELEVITLPDGYEIKPAGSFTLMGDVLSELELVLFMAALLVYLVMAAQFESLLHPFIIICTLPLAYTGSVIALMITGNSISIPAMIGVVVLSGILVNDGIIMVDFINQQRRLHGLRLQEAIIEGAVARLRPILMTTATTVLGLIPLALGLGEGSQLQAPMAITIIGGQITGTILLLLAIPSIYKVLTRETAEQEEMYAQSEAVEYPAAAGGGAGLSISTSRQKSNHHLLKSKDKPLFMLILRMVIVFILAAVILILLGTSGQELLTVIQ